MSEQDLHRMIKFASGICEAMFDRIGEVAPIWHMVTSDGREMIEPQPPVDKDIANMLMRALFELANVVRYVYFGEAWIAILIDKTDEERDKLLQQIDRNGVASLPDADRVEVVMLQAEDFEAGQILAHRRIIRGKGKPRLGPLEIAPWGHSEGRMVGMLPRRGATLQ
jgi:hypothetical protein